MIIFGWVLFCTGSLIATFTILNLFTEPKENGKGGNINGDHTALLIFCSSLMICGAIFIIG